MITYESDCVGCALHCLGNGCSHYNEVKVLICDHCGDEADRLYQVDDKQVCEYCLTQMFEVIE